MADTCYSVKARFVSLLPFDIFHAVLHECSTFCTYASAAFKRRKFLACFRIIAESCKVQEVQFSNVITNPPHHVITVVMSTLPTL